MFHCSALFGGKHHSQYSGQIHTVTAKIYFMSWSYGLVNYWNIKWLQLLIQTKPVITGISQHLGQCQRFMIHHPEDWCRSNTLGMSKFGWVLASFPHFLQVNGRKIPWNRPQASPSKPLTYSIMMVSLSTYSDETALLNNLRINCSVSLSRR